MRRRSLLLQLTPFVLEHAACALGIQCMDRRPRGTTWLQLQSPFVVEYAEAEAANTAIPNKAALQKCCGQLLEDVAANHLVAGQDVPLSDDSL
jgi:hypothetical protein